MAVSVTRPPASAVGEAVIFYGEFQSSKNPEPSSSVVRHLVCLFLSSMLVCWKAVVVSRGLLAAGRDTIALYPDAWDPLAKREF